MNDMATPPVRNRLDLLTLHINGTTPFLSHGDCLNDRLAEASALLTVMSSAFEVADEGIGTPGGDAIVDSIATLRHGIYARAFEGIQTLVHLALYHADNRREI